MYSWMIIYWSLSIDISFKHRWYESKNDIQRIHLFIYSVYRWGLSWISSDWWLLHMELIEPTIKVNCKKYRELFSDTSVAPSVMIKHQQQQQQQKQRPSKTCIAPSNFSDPSCVLLFLLVFPGCFYNLRLCLIWSRTTIRAVNKLRRWSSDWWLKIPLAGCAINMPRILQLSKHSPISGFRGSP